MKEEGNDMSMSLERIQLMTTGMIDYKGEPNGVVIHELAWKDAITFLGRLVERQKTLPEIKKLALLFKDMVFHESSENSVFELVEYEMDYEGTALENYSIATNDEEVEAEYEYHFAGVLLYLINIWDVCIRDLPSLTKDTGFYFKSSDLPPKDAEKDVMKSDGILTAFEKVLEDLYHVENAGMEERED